MILPYKNVCPLSMMQLLSVFFKCKLHFLLFTNFSFFKLNAEWQFLGTHLFFLILKIYQNHIIMGIIFFL